MNRKMKKDELVKYKEGRGYYDSYPHNWVRTYNNAVGAKPSSYYLAPPRQK